MVIPAGAKPKTSWHLPPSAYSQPPPDNSSPQFFSSSTRFWLDKSIRHYFFSFLRGILIDKSRSAILIWKVNVSEEFHRDPYPWSMVMQMEDKRLYNDTKYSGLRPSRHVCWRTRKTVKLSILKKWITPQSFSHHKTKGRENNMLNASMKKVLWILFDQFSLCLSAQKRWIFNQSYHS